MITLTGPSNRRIGNFYEPRCVAGERVDQEPVPSAWVVQGSPVAVDMVCHNFLFIV